MSNTLTIRRMLEWFRGTSRVAGIFSGRLGRDQLKAARKQTGEKRFMRHAGTITGPPDLSSRKGYSREEGPVPTLIAGTSGK